jgi:hypothetical protein
MRRFLIADVVLVNAGAIQAFCQGARQGLLQARAQLGRGVPDGGERAQHQEFALGQG